MAKNMLPVDFRDDILSENMNNRRRYQMINNSDGTVSLVDVTEYEQVGSVFGQAQINAICAAVNGLTDSVSDAFSEEKTYAVGDYAIYENTLYRFTAEKTAGVWNPTVAEAVTVAGELDKLNGNMMRIPNTITGGYASEIVECYTENGRQYINASTVVPVAPPAGSYFDIAFAPTAPDKNTFFNGYIVNGSNVIPTVIIVYTDRSIKAYIPSGGIIAGAIFRYNGSYFLT